MAKRLVAQARRIAGKALMARLVINLLAGLLWHRGR